MRYPLCLLICLGVMGCSSLVPQNLALLNNVSPLEADPAGFAFMLDLPPGVDVRPGSAQLSLMATRSDTGETASGRYVLAATDAEEGKTYRIADSDLEPLRALQAQISDWEAEDDDATSGSLSVALEGCKVEAGPAADATVSILMRTEEGQPFFQLVQDAPVSDVLELIDQGPLQPCT